MASRLFPSHAAVKLTHIKEGAMTIEPKLILYHSPRTRSSGTLILLEELGAPYELQVLNFKTGEQRQPAYLAVNPLGKVPAIVHGDALITEQVAIYIYLADAFPQAKLAPAIGDPLRGPYLRWLAFYGSAFEPAVMDRYMKREPAPQGMGPYGDFDTVLATISAQLRKGPYLFGERFTAADILWGTALRWTTGWGLVPATPEIAAYIERIGARPSVAKVAAKDVELAAQHEAAAAKG
jgi:glutathione S-transferase